MAESPILHHMIYLPNLLEEASNFYGEVAMFDDDVLPGQERGEESEGVVWSEVSDGRWA